jgi:citrate lyase subunit beta/citryl-CoA lyase
MRTALPRPRCSVLYVPATSAKALAKVASLDCDAVIVDLEDAVAPESKTEAREALRTFFGGDRPQGRELVIRINPLSGDWGTEDLLAARACNPDAILLPKVSGPRDILDVNDALDEMDADSELAIWAMVETPRGVLNLGEIAELGRNPSARLACLVAGTNDLAKETGVRVTPDRRFLLPWLTQIVLSARAGGLDALDGVSNDFRDLDAFAAECAQGRDLGFDGKTLIHPAQIAAANAAFSPAEPEIAEAQAIVAAFADPATVGRGVISLDGRMVERLHLAQAERLLARVGHR